MILEKASVVVMRAQSATQAWRPRHSTCLAHGYVEYVYAKYVYARR